MTLRRRLLSFSNIFPGSITIKIVLYCFIIGIVSGLGAALFLFILEWAKFFFCEILAGREIPVPAGEFIISLELKERILSSAKQLFNFSTTTQRLIFFFLPAFGGLISGIIVYQFAPEAEGHGTDAYINSFHNLKGFVRKRVPFIKSIASILTLSTGGSGGREGPIAQIGSGFGSFLAGIFKVSGRDKRRMLIAGTAGGLGAIFRAPLGSALTSVEVLYKEDFESDAIIPAIISSVTSYTVFTAIFGHQNIFDLPYKFLFQHPGELVFYLGMSIFCAFAGIFYIKVFYFIKNDIFSKIKIRRHFKPAIGGLLVGCIGLFYPQALGDGWGYIQEALNGHFAFKLFITLAFFKIIATSFTIGSGGSAGVFGPTIFIGAMLGGGVGAFFHKFFPEIVLQPEAFILVGMSSFFAGVANAPLASLIMVCEMTGGYGLIAPLMLVSAFNILFLKKHSIYEKQVENKFYSPVHLGNMRVNILKEHTVSSIVKREHVICVNPETNLKLLNKIIEQTSQMSFPVLTKDDNKFVGIVSIENVREIMFKRHSEDLLITADVMKPSEKISVDIDLHEALGVFLKSGYHEVPVVDENDAIIGMLKHSDINTAYDQAVSTIMSHK